MFMWLIFNLWAFPRFCEMHHHIRPDHQMYCSICNTLRPRLRYFFLQHYRSKSDRWPNLQKRDIPYKVNFMAQIPVIVNQKSVLISQIPSGKICVTRDVGQTLLKTRLFFSDRDVTGPSVYFTTVVCCHRKAQRCGFMTFCLSGCICPHMHSDILEKSRVAANSKCHNCT